MDIRFDCTNCGKPLVASSSDIGFDVRCPACQTIVSLKPKERERVTVVSPLHSQMADEQNVESSTMSRVTLEDGADNGNEPVIDSGVQAGTEEPKARYRLTDSGVSSPSGIGGWLLFFIITLVLFSPLRNIYSLTGLYWEASPLYDAVYMLKFVVNVYTTTFVFITIYQFYAAYKLIYRKPNAIGYAKRMLLVTAAIAVIANFLLMLFIESLPTTDKAATSLFVAEQVKTILANCFYVFVWTYYLKTSKRVRNTFPDSWVGVTK